MSTGRRTVAGFLTVICALLLVVVRLVWAWPVWMWPVAAAALLLPTLGTLATVREPDPVPREFSLTPDLPLPFRETRERRIVDMELPSSREDYRFRLSATVQWRPDESVGGSPANAAGLAVGAVLARAAEITLRYDPERCGVVRHELEYRLGVPEPDDAGRLEAMAKDVVLTLAPGDRERLDRIAEIRKDEERWDHERWRDRRRRSHLAEDVLKDHGSAVVWWLDRKGEEIDGVVDDLGKLAQLTSAANNEEVPGRYRAVDGDWIRQEAVAGPEPEAGPEFASGPYAAWGGYGPGVPADGAAGGPDPYGAFVDWVRADPRDPDWELFARQFGDLLDRNGRKDVAEEFRERWGGAGADGADAGPDAAAGGAGE